MAKRKDNFTPRPPDYVVKVIPGQAQKDGAWWYEVGKAWVTGKGNLTIHLHPGTVLRWDDGLTIGVFPNTRRRPATVPAGSATPPAVDADTDTDAGNGTDTGNTWEVA